MEYYFLLSLFKCPDDIENYSMRIANEYEKDIKNKNMIVIGEKLNSNSLGYGFGEQEDLIPILLHFCSKFPDAIFGFYHFYQDCNHLTIYTIGDNRVYIDKHSLEALEIGPYIISTSYSFESTQIPNNITKYLNSKYHQPFVHIFIK
jgi:hypothetical protein